MVASTNGITTMAGSNANASNNVIAEAKKAAQTSATGQQTTRNAQILEASLQVSIQSGNKGMELLYRSAIDHINELLAPELGPNALQNAAKQDNSAEATAGRIVSQSTAFFHAYAAQHTNKDPEIVARDFIELIRGGFEKGYGEAKDILEGLGVLGEGSSIGKDIAKTYELVQKGYDDFLKAKLAAIQTSKDVANGVATIDNGSNKGAAETPKASTLPGSTATA